MFEWRHNTFSYAYGPYRVYGSVRRGRRGSYMIDDPRLPVDKQQDDSFYKRYADLDEAKRVIEVFANK